MMDRRLFEAAQTGNINFLHYLLAENHYILHTIALTSEQNPLHIASTAGHVEFVKEILRLRPSFTEEVNQDGFSSLHLASAMGHFEVVKELLKPDPKLCRLEGRNRWTALHYAASRGRVDIIREMLIACPESIEDVNVQKDTALHIAVKNSQFEAIHFMVKWVIEMKKDEIFNMKDELGNTILHLATWRKHRHVIECILGNTGANARDGLVNAVNQSGLSALDILLIFPSEAGDREIEEILGNSGSRRAKDIPHPTVPLIVTDNQTPEDFSFLFIPHMSVWSTTFYVQRSETLPIEMDSRLFEAAQSGNIQILHQVLADNPFILHTIELSSQGINPLDIASSANHVEFVKEIITLRPDFAKQVNQNGFSPIHIAAAIGNLEIVRVLLKVDRKLCRLEGRNKWTALHYAASRGKVDTIQEILLAFPESIEDVTVQKETALHLAVKNSQFEAINFMVIWVREMKKDEILDMKDEHGNSILHLATWKKHRQVVEWLISNTGSNPLEVNALNKSGLTALDVLLIFASDAGDREMEEILRNAGARRARDMTMTFSTTPTHEISNNNIQTPANDPTTSNILCADNLVNYFKFKRGRDSPSDARTALLVIAVLVTTATFQAGLNPPGGVWQDTELNGSPRHEAGRSILGSYNSVTYLLFMVFNSIGFSVSIYMISVLISNFPFQWEFQACICALYFTYNTAITFMAPNSLKVFLTAFSSALPTAIPFIAKLVRKLIMASTGFLTHLKHRFVC